MTEFEIRANNIATAIGVSRERILDFGYEFDDPGEAVSRIYGMFVSWLTACEEARLGGSFRKVVIERLPTIDDESWPNYIMPIPTSTLRKRAESLWGIRVAFTHGDGDLRKVTNQTNRSYAEDAHVHLPGVSKVDERIHVNGGLEHHAIRTIVQIQDILKTNSA
jgi:hypothetical protein